MGAAVKSCLYDCEVVHKRIHPKRHEFRYRLFFFDIDLDELPALSKRFKLLGHNRFNIYSIFDKDHLDVGAPDLRSNLALWLEQNGESLDISDVVRLITMPRVFGYQFNPVCFYFIYNKSGEPRFVVVEVCNTFRELKPWLISDRQENGSFRLTVPKQFYVSPFSSLDTQFDFRVQCPGESLEIHIDDIENNRVNLVSWINGKQEALTDLRLFWYSIRFPLLSVGVMFGIHWQALLLWLKKIPHYKKSAHPESQQDLYRPHRSLPAHQNKK